jgi:pseudouridine-5'-phosphate glycosidase
MRLRPASWPQHSTTPSLSRRLKPATASPAVPCDPDQRWSTVSPRRRRQLVRPAGLDGAANHPVINVSAGAKALLDLPRTLEYLETAGVPVLGWQHDWFPAFYTRSSGLPIPHRVDDEHMVCDVLRYRARPTTGVLLTVPIPVADEIPESRISAVLAAALDASAGAGVTGPAVTPYVLARIEKETDRQSIPANLALARNNATIAARVAVAMTR